MQRTMAIILALALTGCSESEPTQPAETSAATAPVAPAAPVADDAPIAPVQAKATGGCTIDEARARSRAVALLMGDPYGRSAAEVNANIASISCVDDEGGAGKIWRVDVVVPAGGDQPEQIEGFVAVDGTSGEVTSIGLPYLD